MQHPRNTIQEMCAITGTIPESIFKLKNLRTLCLGCNFLEGTFDLSRLNELPNLYFFIIYSNNYLQGIGEVPDFIDTVYFDRGENCYRYEYGTILWVEKSGYNTSEMLAERLAE